MRYLFLLLITLFPLAKTRAQDTYTVDFTDPKSVVNALFYAAQYKNFTVLETLCDPLERSDGDCKKICSLSGVAQQTGEPTAQEGINEFVQVFQSCRIAGEIVYHETEDFEWAGVPLELYPGSPRHQYHTLSLIKRNGNWYLLGM